MTKEAVLHQFFNSFGIPAYPASSVPQDCVFPWITYELQTGSWTTGEIGLTVNVWYYDTDESVPNRKADEIKQKIAEGINPIECDCGYVWLKRVENCQSLTDAVDPKIKRRYLNIIVEFITNY